MLRLAGLTYRVAGWYDLVNIVANYFFSVIYRLHLSKEQVVGWLESLLKKEEKTARIPTEFVPDDLVEQLAAAMARVDVPSGKFIQGLIKKISTNPPAGYRWKKTDQGTYLVKQKGPPSKERPLTRGKKFTDKAFISIWWHTDESRGAHRKLVNRIKRYGGSIYHRKKMGAGFTEYFAYIIVPADEARDTGGDLSFYEEELQQDCSDAQLRLSAVNLSPLSENKPVGGHEVITAPGVFRSSKLNWEYEITDLINGRVKDGNINSAIKKILKNYQP